MTFYRCVKSISFGLHAKLRFYKVNVLYVTAKNILIPSINGILKLQDFNFHK